MHLFFSQRLSNPKPPPYFQRTYSVYKYKYNIKYIQVQVYLFVMAENSELYDLLVRVKNGYDPEWRDYSRADKLIDNVSFNPNNPGKSMITIVFDNGDDFYDLFDLDDDDKWWANAIIHRQVNDDWSRYEIEEDWNQGYIYESLDEENRSNLDKAGFTASKKYPNMFC